MADRVHRANDLARLADRVRSCTLCRLHVGRTHAVPGEGPVGAPLFLIGEAPGRSEDASGRPFVGSAGRILEAGLAAARLSRGRVFIANVVRCRPPGNRRPRADEMAACTPYLLGEIVAVRPRVLVTLGGTALRLLLGKAHPLRDARGKVLAFDSIPLVPTYHPAAILYNRNLKTVFQRDLLTAVRLSRRRRGAPTGRTPPTSGKRAPSRAAMRSARPRD